jgi:t-SNARE complex subunit (syntaxin)
LGFYKTGNLKDATSSLSTIQTERDEAMNRLQVLEQWFNQKEEELRKAVDRYETEKNIRGKDKDDLANMIEEQKERNAELKERIERFMAEMEELRAQHKKEITDLEAKSHDNWVNCSLV